MDRSAFTACVFFLLPLTLVQNTGCDARPQRSSSTPRPAPPAVLAELQSELPGSWRRLPYVSPLATAAVYEPTDADQAQPADASTAAKDAFIELPDAADEPPSPADSVKPLNESTAPNGPAAQTIDVEEDPPVPVDAGEPVSDTVKKDSRSEGLPTVASPEVFQRSQLPWAQAAPRTAEMTAVVQRADERVRHGFQLAERGALFSARAEFIAALQLIAQANDAQQGTRLYSRALTSGLVALKESKDFIRGDATKAEADVSRVVAPHKTPILKTVPVVSCSPMAAAQRYYGYAQEQLAAAAAQEATGSMALFGLGKAASGVLRQQRSQPLESTAHAMVLYQAALMADGRNFFAANELGVLLVENGNLSQAREILIHSVSLSPQPAAWHNLAVVHARLGEKQHSEQALAQATALAQSGRGSESAVQWVDPTRFANLAPASEGLLPPATAAKSGPTASETTPPAPYVAKKGITDWLPWTPRR